MKPKRIVLITGCNGRIGSAVMERLTGRFSDVVGFDRNAPAPPPPDCVRIPVDIASDNSVREGLRILREHHGTRIAAVVHLAAYYDFLGKPSPKYDAITVDGTRRLLRGLREGTGRMLRGRREGFEVEQFIFASTMLVHAPGEPGQLITEDWPIGPTWAYPESKVRTEALIRAERGAIPAVILRLAGVYDDVCHSPPLAHQMQRIYEEQLAGHLYSGETSHGQAFVHLDDVVDAIERAIERRAQLPPETAILIGEPETLSYDELQHTFSRLIRGESWETHTVPGPMAKVGAWVQDHMPGQDQFIKPWMIDRANDHYALDITRARTLLDWAPRRSLRQTLPKMVAAMQADPFGWYREHGLEPPASLTKKAERAAPQAPGQPEHAPASAPGHEHAHGGGTLPAEPAPAHGCLMHACPMHPEICQSSPGNCPRCGTTLEPAAPSSPQAAEYTCPMHPEVVSREPGNCPKCGMTLVPRGAAMEHAGDMMVEDHRKLLWPHYLNLMLGFWLLTSPFTLGYLSDFVPDANQLRVTAERGLPSFGLRNLAMTWSDIVSGVLVIVFSWLSANWSRRYPWAQWANATVGFWLLFAPLAFWTPLSEAYANDTLIGSLVIAFSVLVPMMPGMSMEGMMGKPDIPPGWAYTPASWLQRVPIAMLAVLGFLIARVLGAYQLGHVDTVWEPFFAGSGETKGVMNGTETIITSYVSKAWPIPDGALGAIVYMLELAMTWMGGKDRWRTMPWMVLGITVLIVPLGVVSIYFIIIQPILLGTWCTLCLVAALAMTVMIPYQLDEFFAMGQYLLWTRRQGKPFWRTFWMGGAMEGGSDDTSKGLLGTAGEMMREANRGNSFPWMLVVSTAIGVWFMFTRLTFDNAGTMADSDHLVGSLVVVFSIMALAEVARAVRFINVAFGAWLIAAPWLLDGAGSPLAAWNGVVGGALLIALAIPRGPVKDSYAGWDRYVV
ncbi:MAG: heavy metal-binding domain-containing protein [Thiobacillus sp.]|uniref:SPW repeat domain-containing protein n=1 Tax=Thiobacillus sp. TaxID=924 RepID=UPI00289498C9|nr:vitamin K epoxide reductase family protein [Thiobacillus sp.]MDT3706214.1 heavy metal-binding domain-containing protein [Thiobacillus sp.]